MIPKIIHYVWLGGQPLAELGERCLASWRTHLPDWEIRRWDESNSPMTHPFVRAMMERELYAFASDYVRLEALSKHGGLYLDTDVELLQAPGAVLRFHGLSLGLLSLQNRLAKCSVGTSWISAPRRSPLIRLIQSRYGRLRRAVMNNTIFTREIMPLFRRREFPQERRFEFLEERGVRLYHPDFLCPVRQEEGGKTVPEPKPRSITVHYGTGLWNGRQDQAPLWWRMREFRPDRILIRPVEKKLKSIFRRPKRGKEKIPDAALSPSSEPAHQQAIPRIVHYVWLGQAPFSEIGRRCLQSWMVHLPGWEIRRWDESNSPVDHPFVKKMLAEKKYAFASDYIRLFALAEEGGLYLDTDLELIGNVEPLLKRSCVLAFLSAQNRPSKNSAAMGFFAATARHPWVLELKSRYDDLRKAVMNNTLTTQSLQARGLGSLRDENPGRDFWELGDIRIYHSDFFYPPGSPRHGFQPTFRTLGIHHAEGSWHGQATPLSLWRKFLDYRLDRKVLRPIEKVVKKMGR